MKLHRLRSRSAVVWLALGTAALLCVAWAQEREGAEGAAEGGAPKNFGISDGTMPNDPRNFRRGWGGGDRDYPTWPVSKELPNDVFTFARIRYSSSGGGYGRRYGRSGGSYSGANPGAGSNGSWGWRGGHRWSTDYPDSDLNMSYRLQQLTSLQVNPNGAVVDIDPEQMRNYPFLYMIEVGDIQLTDDEAGAMRNYMLNGGFIMVDDFWGTDAWETFEVALKQMWPDRKIEEIPLEHEIFHMVFPLKVKPQIPHIRYAEYVINQGITWEFDKPGSEHVHYRGVFDDKRRLMMIICWNTDTGEGWEQEGTDEWYFKNFSEKYAYPLGINIIFYALTH